MLSNCHEENIGPLDMLVFLTVISCVDSHFHLRKQLYNDVRAIARTISLIEVPTVARPTIDVL